MSAKNPSSLPHKSKPKVPFRVATRVVRVRRSKVHDAILDDIDGAIRGAIHRTWKHRDDSLPLDAEVALIDEIEARIDGVLATWLDFGGVEE